MVRDFRSEDKGKRVVTADGEVVGTVERVSVPFVHVAVGADLARSVRRRLGWTDEGKTTYRLRKSKVARIDDEELRLRKNL